MSRPINLVLNALKHPSSTGVDLDYCTCMYVVASRIDITTRAFVYESTPFAKVDIRTKNSSHQLATD